MLPLVCFVLERPRRQSDIAMQMNLLERKQSIKKGFRAFACLQKFS